MRGERPRRARSQSLGRGVLRVLRAAKDHGVDEAIEYSVSRGIIEYNVGICEGSAQGAGASALR